MHKQVTQIVKHMASSQQEMANILEAKRHVAVRMAQLTHSIPPQNPGFEGIEALTEHSLGVAKNLAAYLSSLAELEEALAEHIAVITKLVEIPEDEE
ncbi:MULTISPECIES: nucleoside-diphosphate sugar epimerase [Paenibacillus]|uniref:nucleoside-diphosphate sugar epimerase n=1 Tax=Paenibacillus TaxID=44249 RepID=UPI0022B8F28D|nr:nucleoside-diphosphate sugar epimerase [Paenibacillus caseinilyticus]MCZ8519161.1 nucleoside-diphosphate sugar epimerase [Paenibacillus caseinilyticus]